MKVLKYFIPLVLVSVSYGQSDTSKPKKIFVDKLVFTVHSAPAVTFQFNFHYNQAMGQLAGTYNDDFRSDQFINGRSLGSNKGFGSSVMAKITTPNDHIRVTISGSYNRMLTYLFGQKAIADQGNSTFNIYSAGLGIENNFTPTHNVKLYLGAEALASLINGKATLWVENRIYGEPYIYDIKIKNSFRLGASIFGGAEYLLSKRFGANLGFKVTHANLFLREATSTGNNSEINLVDDESAEVPYAGRKQIVFLSVLAGIDFYWGIFEKKYIVPKK